MLVQQNRKKNAETVLLRSLELDVNLVLTRAGQYRGWKKEASRFLTEMGLAA